jgi:transcription elongation factor SPT6
MSPVNANSAQGGTLTNRQQLLTKAILNDNIQIFVNCVGFLKVTQDDESRLSKNRRAEDDDVQDPLDATRIHPEDYELARKMAMDALELDEEDVEGEHSSHVVSLLMKDENAETKLNELNLDEFSASLWEQSHDRKRHTLKVIHDELLKPFAEQRDPFPILAPWDVITMLTSESPRTLREGYVLTVTVIRASKDLVYVRLESGIEGIIKAEYLADERPARTEDIAKRGVGLQAVVSNLSFDVAQDRFVVELSSRESDTHRGDTEHRRIKPDQAYDYERMARDQDIAERKKRAEESKSRRVIKHPNFHNFNSSQAEHYLESQPRGEVVIRPSSKGFDHLAVTWKVDEGLYQHIDVTEPYADPTGQTVSNELIVDATHHYADLDELLVNHVKAINKKVEDLMNHEKFKAGSADELRKQLTTLSVT